MSHIHPTSLSLHHQSIKTSCFCNKNLRLPSPVQVSFPRTAMPMDGWGSNRPTAERWSGCFGPDVFGAKSQGWSRRHQMHHGVLALDNSYVCVCVPVTV